MNKIKIGLILVATCLASNILSVKHQHQINNTHKKHDNIVKSIEELNLTKAKSLINKHKFLSKNKILQHQNTNLLHLAAFFNVKNNLDKIANVSPIDALTDYNNTALTIAAKRGSHLVIEELLKLGANTNNTIRNGLAPLHSATFKNYIHSIKKILSHDPNCINLLTAQKESALHIASSKGFDESVKLLLEFKADTNIQNENQQTALDIALENKHYNCSEILLKSKAACNTYFKNIKEKEYKLIENDIKEALTQDYLGTAKYIALTYYRSMQSPEYDEECKVLSDINCTSAHLCACLNIAHNSLQKHVDQIDSLNSYNVTALYIACVRGEEKAAEALLQCGANPNISCLGWTPLQIAQYYKHYSIIDLLYKYNAIDTDAISISLSNSDTSSEYNLNTNNDKDIKQEILIGNILAAKKLIQLSEHIIEKDKNFLLNDSKCDLMHLRAYFNLYEGLEEAKKFIPIESYNSGGVTPLFLACDKGNEQFVEALLKAGANPNSLCQDNWTALHIAARRGYYNIVKLLLDYKANANLTQKDGWDALEFAFEKNHTDIINLLKSNK